jgi:hypothetical protein
MTHTRQSAALVEPLAQNPDAAGRVGPNPLRCAIRVFLVFFALYLFTWGGHYTTGDGAKKLAWARPMLFGTSAAGLSPSPDGVYSKYTGRHAATRSANPSPGCSKVHQPLPPHC